MLINLQSKKVDTLVSPDRRGSALFAIQDQQRMKSNFCWNVLLKGFFLKIFFLKLNKLGINVSVPVCVRNISRLYCLLNKKNVIVIKMLVKYIRSNLIHERHCFSWNIKLIYHYCSDISIFIYSYWISLCITITVCFCVSAIKSLSLQIKGNGTLRTHTEISVVCYRT